MNYDAVASALQCGRHSCPCSNTALKHCPVLSAHRNGDHMPSLSVNVVNGKVLFRCHRGCDQAAVIDALKQRGLWQAQEQRRTPGWQLVRSYEYHATGRGLVAEHGRFNTETGKAFAWRVPGHTWRDGLVGISIKELPLYRLNDVLSSDGPVWFVEGEKAADACAERGLVAVCLGGGSNQKAFGNALDPLRDRDVVLWPDNDEPGRTFMARIYEVLPQASFVRAVLPPKGDAFDYFEGGGTVEGLEGLIEKKMRVVAEQEHWLRKYEGEFER